MMAFSNLFNIVLKFGDQQYSKQDTDTEKRDKSDTCWYAEIGAGN